MTTAAQPRLTFGHLLRSEWIKLTTLRSPWWAAAIVVALSVGISALMALFANEYSASQPGYAVNIVLMPTMFTVLLATIIGVLQSAGEYSTGMILASTTAAPGRVGNVLAKAINVAVFVFLLCVVSFALATIISGAFLARLDVSMQWNEPWMSWLPLLVCSVAMSAFAVLGLSCGYLLRSPAAAIAVAVGIVFVLPLVQQMVAALTQADWALSLADYVPQVAFQRVWMGSEDDRAFAGAVLGGWALIPLAASVVAVKNRDA